MRLPRIPILPLALAVLAAVPALVTGAAQAAREADLIVSQKNDVETFDPHMSTNTSTHNITINLFDTLVRLADNGHAFVPELAESWRVVDATTWQFKLRRGVKFNNGEDFNAEAVKFTLDSVQDPERKARQRPTYAAFKGARVDDPYTVSIMTHKPYAITLTQLQALMIVPPGYIKKVGWDEFGRKPVGTGAFKFREWEKDVRVVLDANDAYWKGKPKVRTLAFKPIPEDAARIAALQRGEVDIIDAVPYDRIREIESGPNLRISQRQGEQIYIGLDTLRVDPFKKREVRQALNYAVNADGIVKSLLLGYGVRLNGPFFPVTPGYDAHLKPRGYYYQNPDADRLLDLYFSTLDPKKRQDVGRELHAFLREDAPWIFLYQQQDLFGVRK